MNNKNAFAKAKAFLFVARTCFCKDSIVAEQLIIHKNKRTGGKSTSNTDA